VERRLDEPRFCNGTTVPNTVRSTALAACPLYTVIKYINYYKRFHMDKHRVTLKNISILFDKKIRKNG